MNKPNEMNETGERIWGTYVFLVIVIVAIFLTMLFRFVPNSGGYGIFIPWRFEQGWSIAAFLGNVGIFSTIGFILTRIYKAVLAKEAKNDRKND